MFRMCRCPNEATIRKKQRKMLLQIGLQIGFDIETKTVQTIIQRVYVRIVSNFVKIDPVIVLYIMAIYDNYTQKSS
jgi:hypothetical protein